MKRGHCLKKNPKQPNKKKQKTKKTVWQPWWDLMRLSFGKSLFGALAFGNTHSKLVKYFSKGWLFPGCHIKERVMLSSWKETSFIWDLLRNIYMHPLDKVNIDYTFLYKWYFYQFVWIFLKCPRVPGGNGSWKCSNSFRIFVSVDCISNLKKRYQNWVRVNLQNKTSSQLKHLSYFTFAQDDNFFDDINTEYIFQHKQWTKPATRGHKQVYL